MQTDFSLGTTIVITNSYTLRHQNGSHPRRSAQIQAGSQQ
jgi:hypothetical protein